MFFSICFSFVLDISRLRWNILSSLRPPAKKAWLGVAILPILQLLEATRGFSNQSSLQTLSFLSESKISNIKALTFELTLTFFDSIDASSSSINLSEDTSSHENHLVSLNMFISERDHISDLEFTGLTSLWMILIARPS